MALPALLAAAEGYISAKSLGPASWPATDWYISNDFGFTRRGLLGGALRAAANSFDWFDVNLLGFLLTMIAVFSVTTLLILKARNISLTAQLALALSPVFYQNFILWDPTAGGRKDSLAIIFVLIYLLLSSAKKPILKTASSLLILIILPLLTLAHEGIFFFCAPILIFTITVDWIKAGRDWRKGGSELLPLAKSLSLFIPTLITLLIVLIHSTTSVDQAEEICKSWQIIYPELSCIPLPASLTSLTGTENYAEIGGISPFGGGSSSFDLIRGTYGRPMIYLEWIFMFSYAIALIGACFVPLVESSLREIPINVRYAVVSLVVGLCSVTAIFSAPLYLLAIDYGRWVSISLTLVLATCLLYQKHIATAAVELSPIFPLKEKRLSSCIGSKRLNLALIFIAGIVRIPHNTDIWRVRFWDLSSLLGRAESLIGTVAAILRKYLGGIL